MVNNPSARAAIYITRPPVDVFAAFADPALMSRFWFTRRDAGLIAGESVRWYLGAGESAPSFEVKISELRPPERLVFEWPGDDGRYTRVVMSFEAGRQSGTNLVVEETGFGNGPDGILQALDSTGGFNQVVVAAKALLESGLSLNVVSSHIEG